jgi:hypothetical protein
MARQGLVSPIGSSRDVVRHLVGLQAQDDWVAKYALRPRATSIDESGLIRTWVMRGTLHVVSKEDAGWLVALLGPRFIAKQRGRRYQLGLTDEILKKALPIVRDVVPATREEIAAAVRARGIDLPGEQAEAHLVAVAAMSGLIHRVAAGFARLTAEASTVDDPLRELARRYVAGYGPAAPEDFAAWSGLPLTEARQAMADLVPELAEAGQVPSDSVDAPVVLPSLPEPGDLPLRMLGHFDPWLLGYKDRSFTLDPAHAKHIQRGGGFLQPLILVDGRVAGTWSRDGKKIAVTSFGGKLPDLTDEIDALSAL